MSIKYIAEDTVPASKTYTVYRPWNSNQKEYARKLSIVAPDTAQSMFIYNINTKQSIELKLIPNSMSESYASRIIKESGIYGRVRPLNFYTGGGGKTLSFSFDLHEDINNIDGSLYTLLDALKSMSKPKFNGDRGLIQEPLVYFQFGEQFAGKGHINSEYTLNKPYRKDLSNSNGGRYAFANVSITFTFHEEFETSQYLISEQGDVAISSYSIDLQRAYDEFISSGLTEQGLSIEDFIEEVEANQYYITQSFANEKLLGGFLNSVKINAKDSSGRYIYEELLELIETGQRINVQSSEGSSTNYFDVDPNVYAQYQLNEITAAVFNFYVDLSNILSSDLVLINKKDALSNFYAPVFDYYKDLKSRVDYAKIYSYDGNVLKLVYGEGLSSRFVNISKSDAEAAITSLMDLLDIINMQKAIYVSMMAAGN